MRIVPGILIWLTVWAGTASAATVYLRDGSRIKAQKVWREGGMVVVLLNRESIASFHRTEVNLKKTFPPRRKVVQAVAPRSDQSAQPVTQGQEGSAGKKENKKLALPAFPALPENLTAERAILRGKEEGAIRKQKREMEERLKE